MSSYCIGDLHGRSDLFFLLLNKIKFNPNSDRLYILGDVIDGARGAIDILNFLEANNTSCFLIQGNHEDFLLSSMKKSYSLLINNQSFKEAMQKLLTIFSENLFSQIEQEFLNQIKKKRDIGTTLASRQIREWIESGSVKTREQLLIYMGNFLEVIAYDEILYKAARHILRNLRGQYDTKEFTKELFEQSPEDFNRIINYISTAPRKHTIQIGADKVVLMHSIKQLEEEEKHIFPSFISFPHARTTNTMYVFGHEPVPQLHRKIASASGCCSLTFDYRRLFAYCDERGNRYYNLDLGSNPAVALCLDNLNEYYVGSVSQQFNAQKWKIPDDKLDMITEKLHFVDQANFYDVSSNKNILIKTGYRKNVAFITYDNYGCYDFLIGIHSAKKQILYTRIDLLDYHNALIISDWYNNQPLNEVLQKVQDDFSKRLETDELKSVYSILRKT